MSEFRYLDSFFRLAGRCAGQPLHLSAEWVQHRGAHGGVHIVR